MFNSLLHGRPKIKQSQRLLMISREATKIRELHQTGAISAAEAAEKLIKLRENPDSVLTEETPGRHTVDAA